MIHKLSVIFLLLITCHCAFADQAFDDLLAKAQAGDARAQYKIGLKYKIKQDDLQAVSWFTKSAEQGNEAAQFYLGSYCLNNICAKKDYDKMIYWMTKRAEQGDIKGGRFESQEMLGTYFREGKYVTQDYKKAYMWFCIASENGNPDLLIVMDAIAQNLSQKEIIEAEIEITNMKSKILYNKAVSGDTESQFGLAYMYSNGINVHKDLKESYVWFSIVAENGSISGANVTKNAVAMSISPKELEEAKIEIAELQKKIEQNKAAKH